MRINKLNETRNKLITHSESPEIESPLINDHHQMGGLPTPQATPQKLSDIKEVSAEDPLTRPKNFQILSDEVAEARDIVDSTSNLQQENNNINQRKFKPQQKRSYSNNQEAMKKLLAGNGKDQASPN